MHYISGEKCCLQYSFEIAVTKYCLELLNIFNLEVLLECSFILRMVSKWCLAVYTPRQEIYI